MKKSKVARKELKNLREKSFLLDLQLQKIDSTYQDLFDSIVENRTIVLMSNGRVNAQDYNLAQKVLDHAEKELFELYSKREKLSLIHERIGIILRRFDAQKKIEENLGRVEEYVNYSTMHDDSFEITNDFIDELQQLNQTSRKAIYSINSLLELKGGIGK